ncbi:MAG: ATP-binding cassette domain-containing protein [Pseudomonadota bacterium]
MRRNVPEVTQSSAMDCGPAVLAAALDGFGISVSYPRLREACQTDVDGTSIDALEELANRLGVEAEQVMLPSDFVLSRSNRNLPSIVVVRLPNGLTHFVTVWRRAFGFVQIMDPARGRSWMREDRFMDSLYQHRIVVDAEDWLAYAETEEFRAYLLEGFAELKVEPERAEAMVTDSFSAGSWLPIARLDAALRFCRTLIASRRRGIDGFELLQALLESPELIPEDSYQVQAVDEQSLTLRGAVLLRMVGRKEQVDVADPVVAHSLNPAQQSVPANLFRIWRELGLQSMAAAMVGISLLVALVTFLEALVFRYLIGSQPPAELPLLALVAFLVLTPLIGALALEAAGLRLAQVLGRCLSANLHAQLLTKLPRMTDSYFASRLPSDLAERGNAISQLREFPELLRQLLMLAARVTFVLIGLVWLLPELSLAVALAGVLALLAPLAIYPLLVERDLRARTHLGALSRYYLDSLRGAETIGAHGAAPLVRQEQESLLQGWISAVNEQQRPTLLFEALQLLILASLGILLVLHALDSAMALGTVLLIAYWSLFVPVLSLQFTQALKQLPSFTNIARRVLELIDAEEEETSASIPDADGADAEGGVRIEFRGAAVHRGENALLEAIDLRLEAGERVAIVGTSGSGKSSFLGTLLGWNCIDAGELLVDGEVLHADAARKLREQTVLIDPELYLWNRSLYDNLAYGVDSVAAQDAEFALAASELLTDLGHMDAGLATSTGENGSRLSAGEGQRLRLARGLLRRDQRLVLLDEPFTGMATEQRRRIWQAIERRWPAATMLFVSHNVAETEAFARVLVFDGGRIVEDGAPGELASRPGSRYGALLEKERAVAAHLADTGRWRQLALREGEVTGQ